MGSDPSGGGSGTDEGLSRQAPEGQGDERQGGNTSAVEQAEGGRVAVPGGSGSRVWGAKADS